MATIRKPANYDRLTFADLFELLAGQAYVAEQLNGKIESEHEFHSSGRGDACSYELFADGSLWLHSNAEDEVRTDATEFIQEMDYSGTCWDDCGDSLNIKVNDMDKQLLIHLLGEEDAVDFFERRGGYVLAVGE